MVNKHILNGALISEKLLADVPNNGLQEVDAYEFVTSYRFLGIELFPWQSIQIKTFYNLWKKYPPTLKERELLGILETEWSIKIDTENPHEIEEMILVDGRRSGKSNLMSFLAAYEIYSLICKQNPQEYYGLIPRTPIHILHVAVSGEQAEDMFQFTKNRLRSIEFFKPYFDWTKYNESELRVFTPADLAENARITEENNKRKRGEPREQLLEGSIIVQSLTTRAATGRGKSVKLLIFSEFAHFDRPKFDSIFKENLLTEETQQTDYSMWKALTPSVKDYGKDGRVLYESSPRERGGQFYKLYCEAGGAEQEHPNEALKPTNKAVIQLSTWECNPSYTYESLAYAFLTDPVGSNMEYGARFGNPSGNYISESVINSIPQQGIEIFRKNDNLNYRFVISVDPGGQAKKKVSDTYVVSWGHYEIAKDIIFIDGMHGWDEQRISNGQGGFQKINVDADIVTQYIVDLAQEIGHNFLLEIVYDQWQSSQSISHLRKMGLPAVETFFTNQYKSEMYGNFLLLANQGKIKSYGVDREGYLERWKTELKNLQRYISGGTVYYSHPSSGPCMHDDFSDANANMVYRLSLLQTPTRQSLQKRVQNNLSPIVRPDAHVPLKAGRLSFGPRIGGSSMRQIQHKIKER